MPKGAAGARLTMVNDPIRQLVFLKDEEDVRVGLAPGGAVGVSFDLVCALCAGTDRLQESLGFIALASCAEEIDGSVGGWEM